MKYGSMTQEELCKALPGYREKLEEAKAFTARIKKTTTSHDGIYQQGIWKIGVKRYFEETGQKLNNIGGNYDDY
jgi:hypothetical protein